MDHFVYRGPSLWCEEVPLKELAVQFGTPLYVYSHATLARHVSAFADALAGTDHRLCFSVKANSNGALLRILSRLGVGADVVSGGELFRCLEAGMDPRNIVYSGVGKSIPEIEFALRRKILFLSIESAQELRSVAAQAGKLGLTAPIGIRMNPDVDAKTHPHISTGLKEAKFGVAREEVPTLVREAQKLPSVKLVALGMHIGSQIEELGPFVEAVKSAVEMARDLRKMGADLRYLDIGGGLGVRYCSETPPSPAEYVKSLLPLVQGMDLTLILEPGRSLVANAGVLLTRVVGVKRSVGKTFVVVDAGMNDLIRPALYGAQHDVIPAEKGRGVPGSLDIVGPVCETADVFLRDHTMEEPSEGDLLCIRSAGAYGFTMASQYNSRPRPAEVLVKGDRFDLVRKRETFEDLVRGEEVPEWLESA